MNVLKQGDEVLIQTGDNAYTNYTHKELVELIESQKKTRKEYNLSDRGYVSKRLWQFTRAIENGEWTNGRPIDRSRIAKSLISFLESCEKEEVNQALSMTRTHLRKVISENLSSVDFDEISALVLRKGFDI